MSDQALAYMNHGRWIAECPAPGCFDARALDPGQPEMACINGHPATVVWPPNAAQITAALAEREEEAMRDWVPSGHRLAERHGFPANQSPADLRAETAALRARSAERRKQAVDSALAGLSAAGIDVSRIEHLIREQ